MKQDKTFGNNYARMLQDWHVCTYTWAQNKKRDAHEQLWKEGQTN